MANNKSAKKRIEINKRNRFRNRFYKSSVRTLIKSFFQDLEVYQASKTMEDKENVQQTLSSVYSLMDKATKKNVFHENAIARKKAKLASYFKAASLS